MIQTYNISDFFSHKIKLGNFHINRLEEMPPLPAKIEKRHIHNFTEIFLVKNGSTEQNIDSDIYNLGKNNLFFISQGQYHLWSITRKALSGYRLMFANSIFSNSIMDYNFLFTITYINNVYFNPLIKLDGKENKIIFEHFENLLKEYARNDMNIQAIQSQLFLILLEIQRIASKNEKVVNNILHLNTFKHFMEILELHFHTNKPIDYYCNKLNVSESSLNRIIKHFTQLSTAKVIQNRILLEAKRYLTISSLTINEISYKVGFEDPSYFIRLFKKQNGITPKEFRDQYKML